MIGVLCNAFLSAQMEPDVPCGTIRSTIIGFSSRVRNKSPIPLVLNTTLRKQTPWTDGKSIWCFDGNLSMV